MSDVTIRPQVGTYIPPTELGEVAGAIRGIEVGPTVEVESARGLDAPRAGATQQVIEVVLNEGTQLALGAAVGAVTSWARKKRTARQELDELVRIVDADGNPLDQVGIPATRDEIRCPGCGAETPDHVRCGKCGTLLP